jgi:N12 class adenine-specific DNA methylase
MTEARIDGSAVQLVTVCLSDDGVDVSDALGAAIERAPVVCYLRPRESRALAFLLLELAEVAERRSEA